MKCLQCGTEMTSGREDFDYTVASGLPVILKSVEIERCPHCGEYEVVIPRLEQLHRVIAEAVVLKRQRLAPTEIRYLRKSLGWSGVDFARFEGVDPATVSRWENGHENMAAPAERLLRLMVMTETPVPEYPTPALEVLARIEDGAQPAHIRVSVAKDNSWSAAVC